MKTLKATLMLAVFCLTISGTSNKTEMTAKRETIQKIDKTDYQFMAEITKKNTKPPMS